jgi:hypothetical protein
VPNEYPIQLGTLLFTLVEPRRGREREYNRWYERDHFYAGCMIGAWQFAGQRFVATRDCKALQRPSANEITGEGGRGSYLGIYWVLDGHHDEWNKWAVDQVNSLHADGRMFDARDHVHTALYEKAFVAERDADGVPVELALAHRFPGLVAVVGRAADGVDPDEAAAWCRDKWLPQKLAGSPVALVLHAKPKPLLADAPGDVPRADDEERRFLQLWFVDEPSLDAWDEHFASIADELSAGGKAELLWMSPFLPTIPGTDAYVDELW